MGNKIPYDQGLIAVVLALVGFGLIMVFSTSTVVSGELYGSQSWIFTRQLVLVIVGLLALMVTMKIDYHFYRRPEVVYCALLGSGALLVYILFTPISSGVQRWIRLGPASFQPSELAKITTIIALARYLSDCSTEQVNAPRGFLGALCLSLVPMALIVRQPDLGTAISFGAPLFPMLYWAGMRKLFIFLVISPILSVVCSFEPLWQSAAP